jgi:hypothetical protein
MYWQGVLSLVCFSVEPIQILRSCQHNSMLSHSCADSQWKKAVWKMTTRYSTYTMCMEPVHTYFWYSVPTESAFCMCSCFLSLGAPCFDFHTSADAADLQSCCAIQC